MLNSAEKTGTNEFTVDFTISAEDFAAAVMKAYHKNKNKINVPGFRKGKAPKAIIEKMYGENVFYDDALEIAFPDAYDKALEEAGIVGIDNPFDFDIKEVGKEGAHIICKVTVKPEIEIDGYKGLSAVKEAVEVTDEDVNADLERKRNDNAREITVEDRAAENGDIANINFEGFVDDKAFEGGKGEDHDLELGSGSFIPGFEDQIVGHSIGDEFDVNVTFPEEYAEELAGKDAVFKVKLNGIKKKLDQSNRAQYAGSWRNIRTKAVDEAVRKEIDSLFVATVNVVKGKPVTTNVATEGGNVPANLVDGTLQKGWHGPGIPGIATIDIGSVQPVFAANVAFYADGKRTYTFKLEISVDGKEWKQVASNEGKEEVSRKEGFRVDFGGEFPARYVRLTVLKNTVNPFTHVQELEVYSRLAL